MRFDNLQFEIAYLCDLCALCGYTPVSLQYGGIMRATVDPHKCDVAGICVKVCPEIFRFHEGSKKAYVTVSEIPKHLEQKCLEAAKKCPQKAIIIIHD